MKVTIEVDCTPEEARRAVGLPDLTPLHDLYLSKMQEAIQQGTIGPEIVGNVLKSWAPMNDAGLEFWRSMMTSGTAPKS